MEIGVGAYANKRWTREGKTHRREGKTHSYISINIEAKLTLKIAAAQRGHGFVNDLMYCSSSSRCASSTAATAHSTRYLVKQCRLLACYISVDTSHV
jgi:hypothetical protein